MTLATWGDVVFQVGPDAIRTWQSMRRSGQARYHEHDVHLGKPLVEFLGPGNDELTLEVRLDSALGVDPSEDLKTLREARDGGFVHPLIVGGALVFDATLRGMEEDHKRHSGTGVSLVVVVTLSFKEYV